MSNKVNFIVGAGFSGATMARKIAEELNEKLKKLTTGKMITVVYYNDGEYIQLTGIVVKIEKNKKYLQMAEIIIPIDDISDIIE